MPRRFLTADWRYLLMLNYEIDPAVVEPLIPAGTELDFFNDKTYVSIVGFRFLETRVLGCPIPFHTNFDEINLRFYVRRRSDEGWRRGVVFIKEVVPKWAIANVARRVYNENYVCCRMRSTIQLPESSPDQKGLVEYTWRSASQWNRLSAEFSGEPAIPPAGSLEEFITEHYWGYTGQRDGGTLEYQVTHPKWSVWPATEAKFECHVAEFYGREFTELLSGSPTSAFVAQGSAIEVYRGVRIEGDK